MEPVYLNGQKKERERGGLVSVNFKSSGKFSWPPWRCSIYFYSCRLLSIFFFLSVLINADCIIRLNGDSSFFILHLCAEKVDWFVFNIGAPTNTAPLRDSEMGNFSANSVSNSAFSPRRVLLLICVSSVILSNSFSFLLLLNPKFDFPDYIEPDVLKYSPLFSAVELTLFVTL